MLLAYRLVRLIEAHSDELAGRLLNRLKDCSKTCDYGNVPPEEFRQRVHEIYQNLGEWLLGRPEVDIETRYAEIGRRRREQNVPVSQLICAISLTKENLFEFLKEESFQDKAVEVSGELEVLQLLEQFFDRAMYYSAIGYEGTQVPRAVAAQS